MYTGISGGVGPLCTVLNGELLPSNLRTYASGVVTACSSICSFVVVKLTPLAQDTIGLYGMYWTFSLIGYALIAFTYFVVPETFGRSLEELEDHYRELCYGRKQKTIKYEHSDLKINNK